MDRVDKLFEALQTPGNLGRLTFFVCALFALVFGDTITTFFLDVSPESLTSVVERDIYGQASIIMNGLLVALVGFIIYVTVTQNSITRRARTLAEELTRDISQSREQFQALYENSPAPYFLMDDMGSVHNPNKAALRFFGGTREECEIVNLYQVLTKGEAHGGASSLFREKVERNFPISREGVRIRTIKGEYRWALVSVHSLERNSKIPFRHLVTLIDVTEEKETERVKSDFLLLASHQLRTPMTTIKWYTDYLLHTPSVALADEVREYLEEIDMGNQRMIELVNTLLTVSRLEMGTLAPEYVQIHVNELVQDILTELSSDIKKRSTNLTYETYGDDLLTSDRTMVRISIHNLLTNAIKYTPSGGSVHIVSNFGSMGCTIKVTDSGCGIPLAEQDKIFTKMYRASNARKMSTSGTGLGLHMTRLFVQKLGGDLEFVSEVDKGTTFTISLPRVAPDA